MNTPILDHLPDFVVIDGAFDPSECSDLIESYINHPFCRSGNYSEGSKHRRSTEVTIPVTERFVAKTLELVYRINNQHFGFDLTGLEGDSRLIKYCPPGDHFDWHTDRSEGVPIRKLSFSVQLTPPHQYDGGELQIHNGLVTSMIKTVGSLIVFPSYVLHQVAPVVRGERYSLVGWISGSPFK